MCKKGGLYMREREKKMSTDIMIGSCMFLMLPRSYCTKLLNSNTTLFYEHIYWHEEFLSDMLII
jgi:hypothetical protein